jgi:hypothetical protein
MGTAQQIVPTTAAPHSGLQTGWDPYEVWRTRVLLPRVAVEERAPQSRAAAVLVVTQPIGKDDKTSTGGESTLEYQRRPNDDEALEKEAMNLLGSLCLAAVTIILSRDPHPSAPRYARRERLQSPRTRL